MAKSNKNLMFDKDNFLFLIKIEFDF